MEIPPLPDMTENEILDRTAQLLGSELCDMDYAAIVSVLTVANYMMDICIRELGDRNLLDGLEDFDGVPVIPDARPASMYADNVVNIRPGD